MYLYLHHSFFAAGLRLSRWFRLVVATATVTSAAMSLALALVLIIFLTISNKFVHVQVKHLFGCMDHDIYFACYICGGISRDILVTTR